MRPKRLSPPPQPQTFSKTTRPAATKQRLPNSPPCIHRAQSQRRNMASHTNRPITCLPRAGRPISTRLSRSPANHRPTLTQTDQSPLSGHARRPISQQRAEHARQKAIPAPNPRRCGFDPHPCHTFHPRRARRVACLDTADQKQPSRGNAGQLRTMEARAAVSAADRPRTILPGASSAAPSHTDTRQRLYHPVGNKRAPPITRYPTPF